jgi:phosphoribosylanthranilate isomerase
LRIKICGITNASDGLAAAALGADAIGLNFYSHSPRFVGLQTAQVIARCLPPFVEPIALFVKESAENIRQHLESLRKIRTIQWHGEAIKPAKLSGYGLIPAFPISEQFDVHEVEKYLDECEADDDLPGAVLFDARVPGQYGGTGKTAPWALFADFKPRVPLILAGGLGPDNVAEAIRIVRPYAVDVAGGVEKSPGVKDKAKMERFIQNARDAAAKHSA